MIEYENLGRTNKSLEKEYKECFSSFLESGWYVLGKEVRTFEESFAGYCGVKHCIGVASGLDALMRLCVFMIFRREVKSWFLQIHILQPFCPYCSVA